MTKREALTEILVAFGELHQREISPMLVTVFLDALGHFSIEELQAAGRRLLASEEFFPKPIKFIETIQGSVEDRGALAWNLLVEALRKYSAWDSLEITDDPAFVYALEQVFGSWIRCGDTLPDAADPMFASLRKQFMGSYRAYDRSGRTIALPRRLAGRHEANNLQSFPNWRDNMQLPPQTIHVLSGGQWQQGAIQLNRELARFEIITDRPQLGPGNGK